MRKSTISDSEQELLEKVVKKSYHNGKSILCTLPSEIVRTVLVSAIKNHCWLWTTICRWKKEIGYFFKNSWKAYEIARLVMLNKHFFDVLKIIQHVRSLKKKLKIFSNSLPRLQLLARPRENFSNIWKLYDIETKILFLIQAKKTSKIFMGTRDTIKNVQSCLSWILIDDHGSRPVCCSPLSLRQDWIGHALRWCLSGALLYVLWSKNVFPLFPFLSFLVDIYNDC